MNNISFEKARNSDLDEICHVCHKIVNYMKNDFKIDQWDENYPNKDVFLKDIKKDELFILKKENNIVGFICINYQVYEQYDQVTWEEQKQFKTFHRIGIDPDYHHKGYGKKIFKYAEEEVLKQNINYIRVDTYSLNIPMNNLIKKMNFDFKGAMVYKKDKPVWNCYEKKIT